MASVGRRFSLLSLKIRGCLLISLMACSVFTTQGCSVYLALHQPSPKDLSVLKAETPQEVVVAELGPPIWMGTRGSDTVAVHKFVQGHSTWMKRTRALLHAVADIPSFGLWEIPGTAMERFGLFGLHGVSMTVKISYDADGKVRTAKLFDSYQIPAPLRAVESGSLGIALSLAPESDLQTPSKGRLAGVGRGAATGAVVGSAAGAPVIWAPPLAVFVAGGGMIVGSLTGAVYGAISSEPVSSVEKTEAILKTALQDLRTPESLRDEISTEVRQDLHLEVRFLEREEVDAAHIHGSYPALDSRGMTTMLQLDPVEFELRNPELGINPDIQLIVRLSVRLIRTVDGLEVGSWYLIDTDSGSLSLDRWAADNGRAFRSEVLEATRRLAHRVLREISSTEVH